MKIPEYKEVKEWHLIDKIKVFEWLKEMLDKNFISKEQARKELKKRLLTPNTKSKNYIEIPDFEYWLDKVME